MTWWCLSGMENYSKRYEEYPTRLKIESCCDKSCCSDSPKEMVCAPCCPELEHSLWNYEKRGCREWIPSAICTSLYSRFCYGCCDILNFSTATLSCPVTCIVTTVGCSGALIGAACAEGCSLCSLTPEERSGCHNSAMKCSRWACNYFANGMICSAGLTGLALCSAARLPVDLLVPEMCFLCCYKDQFNWWFFRSTRCDYKYCQDESIAEVVPPKTQPKVKPSTSVPTPPVQPAAPAEYRSDGHAEQMMQSAAVQASITMMMNN